MPIARWMTKSKIELTTSENKAHRVEVVYLTNKIFLYYGFINAIFRFDLSTLDYTVRKIEYSSLTIFYKQDFTQILCDLLS